VAGNEPVTSPDQRKPVNPRKARIGALLLIVALVVMALFGNHRGNVENVWLLGFAGVVVLMLIGDWILRRNGLRD
jgi:hypothetical protein